MTHEKATHNQSKKKKHLFYKREMRHSFYSRLINVVNFRRIHWMFAENSHEL